MTMPEAWCRAYTLLAPIDDAERRRAELASHVHEARAAGVPAHRLALQTGLGAAADLVWTDRARRRAGAAPLALVPLLDAGVGAIVAGALVLVAYGISTLPSEDPQAVTDVVTYLALACAGSGHVAGLIRRFRRR